MFKGLFDMVGVARVELATNPLFKGVYSIWCATGVPNISN